MYYQRASKFIMLALVLVVLGTDRLVLAQRRAKTKPAARSVQKPQGTEAELRDYAKKYIDQYFTRCGGDSLYSYAKNLIGGGRRLLETKDLRIEVTSINAEPNSFEVSKADRLNGIEGQGYLYIEPVAYRTYDFAENMWSKWKEGKVDPLVLGDGDIHNIYWTMEKRNGVWSVRPHHNYLTNAKVKVKCDNITAPVPVWEEEP